MPAIYFPNLTAVGSALTGRAVPAAISRTPARVGFGSAGEVWVQTAAPITRDAVAALKRLGAAVHATSEIDLTDEVGTWLELVPLVPAPINPDDRPSPVLFDVPDTTQLPVLVAELRRLGAGKIGMRWLDPSSPPAAAGGLGALVLVESPPFHSLIRSAPRAFAQQASRVWVEVGWRHPLAETIHPPPGRLALLAAPRVWRFVADGPFSRGPESFAVPNRPTAADGVVDLALPISLHLVPDHSADPPELWVLHDRPIEQLRALAEQSDDRLLARLSVAVGIAAGRQVAVLRARPGGSPVLLLDALPCRALLRLPNLYLPVGRRLRPPLRRDAVRRLLAPEADTIAWLEPDDGGSFTIHHLPESAFRPLHEIVAYGHEHAPRPLAPVIAAAPFALPAYVHPAGGVSREAARPASRRRPPPTEPPAPQIEPLPPQPGLLSRIVRWFAPGPDESPRVGRPALPEPRAEDEPPRALDASQGRRRALEQRLLAVLNSADDVGLPALWPELAHTYAAVRRPGDAAVCWLNALWEVEDPPPQWHRGWLRAEARSPGSDDADNDWRRRMDEPPTPAGVRALAAAVAGPDPPALIAESLGRVQRLLEEHEDQLPVRAAWLARLALTRLTGGDPVGLARTRDRLLERLHEHGLSADLDLPAGLRFAGSDAGDRADAVRGWLTRAREPIHRWLAERPVEAGDDDPRLQAFGLGTAIGPTRAYADLILAWGLARLGERAASDDLLTHACGVLAPLDAVHRFLLDAFNVRITQALDGRGGPLPADLLARLTELRDRERTDRAARERLLLAKVQHLLQHSRILEPNERVDVFSAAWLEPHAAHADHAVTGLRYVADRQELATKLLPLVDSAGGDPDRLPHVLAAGLDLAPRLGESVAAELLDRLLKTVASWTFAGPAELILAEVTALERGLFLAAHFDRTADVRRLVTNLDRLLEVRRGGDSGESRPIEDALLTLVAQGLRGLRRLGLRAEAERLFDQLDDWVVPGGDLAAERRRRPQAWPLTLRRLLTLAGGWFYLGRDGPAIDVLDEARRLLFSHQPSNTAQLQQQTDLACAYAAALGHAPVRLALNGVEELFVRLHGVSDSLVTNTHYSLAKLRLVEAAVRAVVTDDFALGPAVRRWLDDDEYRVRRRIHRDTRNLLGAGG